MVQTERDRLGPASGARLGCSLSRHGGRLAEPRIELHRREIPAGLLPAEDHDREVVRSACERYGPTTPGVSREFYTHISQKREQDNKLILNKYGGTFPPPWLLITGACEH